MENVYFWHKCAHKTSKKSLYISNSFCGTFYGIDTPNAKNIFGGTRSSGGDIHHFRQFWVELWVEITQNLEKIKNFKFSICDSYVRGKVCTKIYLESELQGKQILTLSRRSEHFSKVVHTSLSN